MHVLMLSSDAKIFEEGSSTRRRMTEYATLFDGLAIVVVARRGANGEEMISPFARVFGFSSPLKIIAFIRAYRAANLILNNSDLKWTISSQDPFELGILGLILAKKFESKLQVQVHTDFLSPYFKKSSLLNYLRVYVGKRIIVSADRIRVVSDRIKNSLIQNLKLKIKNSEIDVLPIFVDSKVIINTPITSDLHSKYPQFKKIILMASRITSEKDFDTAVISFHKLIKSNENVGLVIVGSGGEKDHLKVLVNNLKLEDSVIFENWVNQETLFSYYKTADVFLSTSLFEGYGLSMVEAKSANLPVVATDAGVAPLIAYGGACPVGDTDCLAERLKKALKSSKNSSPVAFMSKDEYLANYAKTLLL